MCVLNCVCVYVYYKEENIYSIKGLPMLLPDILLLVL